MRRPNDAPGPEQDWTPPLVDRFAPRGAGDGGCLDENLLAGFLGDGLVPDERSRVEEHLARCEDCRSLLTGLHDLAQPLPRDEAATPAAARPPFLAKVSAAVALAAALLIGAWLVFGSRPLEAPTFRASVASAESTRGGAPGDAFAVEITPDTPGFARILAFSGTGPGRDLPLRDGRNIARVASTVHFGEFAAAGCFRVLVLFAADRERLADADRLLGTQIPGTSEPERARALEDLAAGLRRAGIGALVLGVP